MSQSPHSRHSVLREIALEHLFVGETLRLLWQRQVYDAEVLRSEFDAGGFDLVIARGSLVRHVQMKALRSGGKRRHFNVSERLASRPSGCVVCAIVSDDLHFAEFWLLGGGRPGDCLPDISGYPNVRHTKADSTGYKAEREGHRRVPLSAFIRYPDLPSLLDGMLGELAY